MNGNIVSELQNRIKNVFDRRGIKPADHHSELLFAVVEMIIEDADIKAEPHNVTKDVLRQIMNCD